ncbi:MAG: DUF4199 domain-containing protein [Bacteroidota bacterium]|nr:DUF4199 domain-containing protein [Bacteroidota bacterium]
MPQKITTTITKGLIIGLIMIAVSIGETFMGISMNGSFQWVIYLIFFVGIIWSIMQYGKQVDHNSTFGNYFAHGFKVAATVTILMIVFLIIFMAVFPEFKEKGMDEARKKMSEKNNVSQEQIDKTLELTKRFFTVFLIGGALIGYLFLGAIASLIGAGVTKKNPRLLEEEHINQMGT